MQSPEQAADSNAEMPGSHSERLGQHRPLLSQKYSHRREGKRTQQDQDARNNPSLRRRVTAPDTLPHATRCESENHEEWQVEHNVNGQAVCSQMPGYLFGSYGVHPANFIEQVLSRS